MVPPGSEVLPLHWTYEDEDYSIAVLVDDEEDSHAIEDRLLDTIIDNDEAHTTYTSYMVWPKQKNHLPGSPELSCPLSPTLISQTYTSATKIPPRIVVNIAGTLREKPGECRGFWASRQPGIFPIEKGN
jgi:hypothetical protein